MLVNHKIKRIEIDKKIQIVFDDGQKIKISRETFLHANHLYEGKILSNDEYLKLLNYEDEEVYRSYIRNIIIKKPYSVYQLVIRLMDKKLLDSKKARKIVGDLEKDGTLNDKDFAKVKIEILKTKGKSPEYIRHYLLDEARVDKDIIESLKEDIDRVDENVITFLIDKTFNKYKSSPINKRKEKAKKNLMSKGYSFGQADYYVDRYMTINMDKIRENNVTETYKISLVTKYLRKYFSYVGETKYQKVYKSLLKEGLESDEIDELLKAHKEELKEFDEDKFNKDVIYVINHFIKNSDVDADKKQKIFVNKLLKLGYNYIDIYNRYREVKDELD